MAKNKTGFQRGAPISIVGGGSPGGSRIKTGVGAQGQGIIGLPAGHPDNPMPPNADGSMYWADAPSMPEAVVNGSHPKTVLDATLQRGAPVSDREADSYAKSSGMRTSGMKLAPNPLTGKTSIQPAQVASRNAAKQQLNRDVYKGTVSSPLYGKSANVSFGANSGQLDAQSQDNLAGMSNAISIQRAQDMRDSQNAIGGPGSGLAPDLDEKK